MGVFSRVSNMFRAKVNDALDEVENPVELLNQKIRDMEESLSKAKLSSAQVLGNVHVIEKQMEDAKKDMLDYEEKVKLALAKGNEDLAKKALQRKLDCEKNFNNLKSSYELAKQRAEALKKNLQNLEKEISDTRTYRDEAEARYKNAEAAKQVNEIVANVQTKTNKINIDDIERKIQKKEALAEGLGDLKAEDSLENEFAELDTVDLDAELAKYKQN
ncbi:PspA/IM30 family protein [Clostridium sp. 19966]|uniref:PspA/IM30 family protein n=1 Tax=Clostridium sp. 19966 TaxID=2768166 RepID=UPI0028DE32AC|nr:PspA/IM30 family protein [Clostridium sp. 19966]MDT8716323.1 PspA/IM30 family protein [Clostridium sp. 19966]